MAFANDGEVMPLSFLKREPQEMVGERVFSPSVAREVRAMMETVTQEGGTGTRTRVPGYRVAGPVFAQVMAGSLRQLALPPDAPETATRVTQGVPPVIARVGGGA